MTTDSRRTMNAMRGWLLMAGPILLFSHLGAAEARAQSWRDVTTSRQLQGEQELVVHVRYGAGNFKIKPAGEGRSLYRMQLRYDEDRFAPVSEYRNGRLDLGIEGTGRRMSVRGSSAGEMDISLARNVPMDLGLELGAVRADLDLGGLALRDLQFSTGASETTIDVSEPNSVRMKRAKLDVGAASFSARRLGNLNAERIEVSAGVGDVKLDFSGQWRDPAHIKVSMGLGSLELAFPRGLGVKIDRSTFLTSFDSQGLVKRGDSYFSEGWENAAVRVTVQIDAAFGSINVVWLDP